MPSASRATMTEASHIVPRWDVSVMAGRITAYSDNRAANGTFSTVG